MIPPARLAAYAQDPVAFIDDLVTVNERGQPFRLFPHQREILRAAFTFDAEGRLAWDTFVYSCRKKSGKTTVNAALLVWWAFTQEPPNELYCLANDQEQARSRVYRTATRLIKRNPGLASSAVSVDGRRIVLSNESEIAPLASDYSGNAGADHGFTSWDELWAYVSEGSRRLWEELTPVPTRRNSIRVITTYAGWQNESSTLWDLYRRGVGPEEHPDGQGERVHETLPLYFNAAARLLVYWDREARLPWQTEAYDRAQATSLRAPAFLRMHRNVWSTSSETFITAELWDGCVDPTHHPLLPTRAVRLFGGVDGATKRDSAAVAFVAYDGDRVQVVAHEIWTPRQGEPLDLETTVEAYLLEMHQRYALEAILADPFQLVRSIATLRAGGVPIEEYPQTVGNVTAASQALFDVLTGRNLRVYPSAELREQALNTVAVENPRGWKISKERASKKIDVIVALAMATYAATRGGPPIAPAAVLGAPISHEVAPEVSLRNRGTRFRPAIEDAELGAAIGQLREPRGRSGRFWR